MSELHPVGPGDHLSRIAALRRIRSYVPLWEHEPNTAIRSQRGTPHILAVGDVVSIPAPELREVERATGRRHRFRAQVPKLVVRLRLLGTDGRPRREPVSGVMVDGETVPFETPADGEVEVAVPRLASRVVLSVSGGSIELRVGFLQHIDTLAGQRERLNNLGYRAGDLDDAEVKAFRSAVEEFQCDQGLHVDGIIGRNAKAALVKAHGC
jgi:hypothetical protein